MIKSLFNYFSVGRNSYNLPRNELSACLQRTLDCVFNAAAAGNLHSDHLDAFDVVLCDDGGQLFCIIALVQLGTADQGDVIAHEIRVKVGVSVGRAVGSDQQVCTVKVGCAHRNQLDLTGPLRQLTSDRRALYLYVWLTLDGFCHGAGAGTRGLCGLFLLSGKHGTLVIGGCFTLFKGNSARGTGGQAIARSIS